MTTFAIITAIASLLLLAGFIALSAVRFGWETSYSSYAAHWADAVPIKNMNLWSIVTFAAAFLLCPALLERGEGDPWQFLGFFMPLYLIVVSFTPKYETDPKQRKVHIAGALSCAFVAMLWIILVRHLWWVPLSYLAVAAGVSIYTKTLKTCYVMWGELVMFASAYTAVFM